MVAIADNFNASFKHKVMDFHFKNPKIIKTAKNIDSHATSGRIFTAINEGYLCRLNVNIVDVDHEMAEGGNAGCCMGFLPINNGPI